jgi:hypothetical protein
MEPHARPIGGADAVHHERVGVHVEIERHAKALDDGHGAGSTIRHQVR